MATDAPLLIGSALLAAALLVIGLAAVLAAGLFAWARQVVRRKFQSDVEAEVESRLKAARALHDGLLQGFQGTVLSLQATRDVLPQRPLEAARMLDQVLRRSDLAIEHGIEQMRALDLVPRADLDLVDAVGSLGRELCGQSEALTAPAFSVAVCGPIYVLNPLVRDELYRVAREAVCNAFAHAQAEQICVEMRFGLRAFTLLVQDDGVGFDRTSGAVVDGRRSGGLQAMLGSARAIGARLQVWSRHGAGTEVILRVPAAASHPRLAA